MKSTKLTPQELSKLQAALKTESTKTGFWSPEKAGETILGVVSKIATVVNKKGSKKISSRVVTLETPEGEKAFYLKTVLEKRFKELNVKIGDKIGVEYLGAKMDGKKISYHKYAVVKL